jgi:hypothetical protein
MSSNNSGAVFNRGFDEVRNPQRTTSRGVTRNPVATRNDVQNVRIENCYSSRGSLTQDGKARWTHNLSQTYKNVDRIDLSMARIPFDDLVGTEKKTVYLAIGKSNLGHKTADTMVPRDWGNIYFAKYARHEEERFSMNGMFAQWHFPATSPILFEDHSDLPVWTISFPVPLSSLERLTISLLVEPDDPEASAYQVMDIPSGEDIRFTFRIFSSN